MKCLLYNLSHEATTWYCISLIQRNVDNKLTKQGTDGSPLVIISVSTWQTTHPDSHARHQGLSLPGAFFFSLYTGFVKISSEDNLYSNPPICPQHATLHFVPFSNIFW